MLKKTATAFRARARLMAGLALLFLLLINLSWAALYALRPQHSFEVLPAKMIHENGHAYTVHLPNLSIFYGLRGDDLADLRRSSLRLYEDAKPLGPAHSAHDSIRSFGGGAFSHWGRDLYFSSSDNSDPRSNGRVYRVEVRATMRTLAAVFFIAANLLGLLVFVLGAARREMISKAALLGSVVVFFAGMFFSLNLIPVTLLWGRAVYFLFAFLLFFSVFVFLFLETKSSKGTQSAGVRFFRKLQLFAASCLLLLLSLEAFCRAFPVADTLAVNPGCRFFWSDWYQYPLNQYGYREREIPEKAENVYRVLIYGDSYIEGAGVARKDLAGIQVERLLNERLQSEGSELQVQAYNLGHCGANTKQEVAWIERDLPVLKPDLIVLAYVLNDAESDVPALVSRPSPAARFFSTYLTGDHGSYFYYRWLRLASMLFPAKRPAVPEPTPKTYIEALHDEANPGWHETKKAFQKYRDLLSENSVDHVAVVLPLFTQPVSNDMIRVMEQVSQEMTRKGIENYNLLDYFGRADLARYAFNRFDSHPNALGHLKLAEFLSGVILKRESFLNALQTQKESKS